MGKILALSNLHGRHEELLRLLGKVYQDHTIQSFDKIVLLGDYIAFGKKNLETIKTLMELQKRTKNIVLLKGNWEDVLWTVQRSKDEEERKAAYGFIARYGQTDMLKQLRENKELFNEWLDCIEKMPLYAVEDDYIFAHAGVDISLWKTGMSLEEFLGVQDKEKMLWSIDFHKKYLMYATSRILTKKKLYDDFPYKIVFGQTAINKILEEDKTTMYNHPFHIARFYGVDFGGIYAKGRLGAVIFDDEGLKTYTQDVGQTNASIKKEVPKKEEEKKSEPMQQEVQKKEFSAEKKTVAKEVVQQINQPKTQTEKEKPVSQVNQNGRQGYTNTHDITLELYQKGMSVKEIAEARKLKEATIETHFIELYRERKIETVDFLYKKEHEKVVLDAFQKHGTKNLGIIKKEVPREVSFTAIKIIGVKNWLL